MRLRGRTYPCNLGFVALSPGDDFDRYRIEQMLGQGGWGEVYRAIDTRLRRKVALKVLKKERAAEAPRFLREARAAAALDHPNVVSVFDLGEVNGVPYIAMELAEGRLLSEFAGPNAATSVKEKVGWLIDVARGLDASHKAGLLHRDVKPQNVMVTKSGPVKVLDFGLAKPTEQHETLGPETQPAFMTRAGHVVGTPRYMAPEALRGALCDGRADQYSWGVTAYEVFAGVHPRGGKADPVALIAPRLLSEFVPHVSFALAAAVARTLSGDREKRFSDMGALIAALQDCLREDERLPPTREAPPEPRADVAPPTRVEGSAATVRDPSFSDLTDPSRPPVMTARPQEVAQESEITRRSASPLGERTKPPPNSPLRQSARDLSSTAISPGGYTAPPRPGPTRVSAGVPPPPRKRNLLYLTLGIVALVGVGVGLGAAYVWRTGSTPEPPSAAPSPSAPHLRRPHADRFGSPAP
jgi:serine/threonine protein kinase